MAKPIFGTKEWAKHSADISIGCSHGCKYCYASAEAVRAADGPPLSPEDWRKGPWVNVRGRHRLTGLLSSPSIERIMFPAHHDIVAANFSDCHDAIRSMLAHGNELLLVTKPHMGLVTELCRSFEASRDKILWRITIGTTHENVREFWEPGAPPITERLDTLAWLSEHGWNTSVSCEPMLDNCVESVVGACIQHVSDALWIGMPNFLEDRLRKNGYADGSLEMRIAAALMAMLTDERVKEIYAKFKDNPKIRWKESIKKIVGLPLATEPGMDV